MVMVVVVFWGRGIRDEGVPGCWGGGFKRFTIPHPGRPGAEAHDNRRQ